MDSQPPIDPDRVPLVSEWTQVDAEFLPAVAPMLREMVALQVAEMESALAAGDWEKLSRTAHSLKGSLAVFAAKRAVVVLCRVEDALAHKRAGDIPGLLSELKAVLAVTLSAIELRCAENGSGLPTSS